MNGIGDVSKAASEGASGTTDIAQKTTVVVENRQILKKKLLRHMHRQMY